MNEKINLKDGFGQKNEVHFEPRVRVFWPGSDPNKLIIFNKKNHIVVFGFFVAVLMLFW